MLDGCTAKSLFGRAAIFRASTRVDDSGDRFGLGVTTWWEAWGGVVYDVGIPHPFGPDDDDDDNDDDDDDDSAESSKG